MLAAGRRITLIRETGNGTGKRLGKGKNRGPTSGKEKVVSKSGCQRKKKRERELKGFVKFRNQEFHGVHCHCLESK